MTERYKIAGPDIVHESFGGDLVVLNLRSGQYFGLNASGAALWSAIIAGQDAAGLSADDTTKQMASGFVTQLLDHELIIRDDLAGEGAPTASISLLTPPTIEAYDDLSDLIVADPIHDVDQNAGWPKLPDAQ
ncbi:hypothetical protein SAMN05421665_2377 [Yoonia rosea]|uniref:Coenzyme PQQ synthesis protein D (PqqD) n=1 Tax=Yoonia rosea TaxID=287098 RepID=A0A1R3X8I5_9RHOB|nr:PqqD family protein [Yoonia rosea]SIT87379.1 hypothetical protein SAMN05421665_2377 [Yoonia rosea]